MSAVITFVPMTRDDVPLMHRWLNNPNVAEWYGAGGDNHGFPTMDEVAERYEENFEDKPKRHGFIMHLDGRPVGYIQCYRIGDSPNYARDLGVNPDAWAIDIFIGEDDARGRGGIGSRAVEQLLEEQVFSRPGVTICFICPDPANKRAIRAYEKAGFRYVKEVWIESEKAHEYVMRLDREMGA